VDGQRMFDNNYLLDDVSMIAAFVNGSTFVPSLEALQGQARLELFLFRVSEAKVGKDVAAAFVRG
jgi:hypothetical protein